MKIIRAIVFIINLIAALGLIATTLAGIVSPSRSVLPSLLAYGYFPMLVVNVLFVLLWLLFGRWELLLSVAAIALRWYMVPLHFQVGGTTKVPPAEEHPYMVTMMTYNVHHFKGNDTEEKMNKDSVARLFVRLVRNESPDILCLQEYGAVKRVNVTDSLTLLGYNHYAGSRSTKAGVPYGSVVFSRLPITFVKAVDNHKVLVEVMRDGKRMRVLCVHMDSYGLDSNDFEAMDKIRHGEVNEVDRRTLDKVRTTVLNHEREWHEDIAPMIDGCTMPMVIAGDMNDIPSSWLYHRLTRTMKDTYVERGVGRGNTWGKDLATAVRIDMIMHNDSLNTLSHKRIKTPLSDHYPVLVALEFEI